MAAVLVLGTAPYAEAAVATVSAEASTSYQVGDTVRTVSGSKSARTDVKLYYTNGIGWAGNNSLKFWLLRASDETKFAGPRYAEGTNRSYILGYSVIGTTRFIMAWQATNSPGLNKYWEGSLTY